MIKDLLSNLHIFLFSNSKLPFQWNIKYYGPCQLFCRIRKCHPSIMMKRNGVFQYSFVVRIFLLLKLLKHTDNFVLIRKNCVIFIHASTCECVEQFLLPSFCQWFCTKNIPISLCEQTLMIFWFFKWSVELCTVTLYENVLQCTKIYIYQSRLLWNVLGNVYFQSEVCIHVQYSIM